MDMRDPVKQKNDPRNVDAVWSQLYYGCDEFQNIRLYGPNRGLPVPEQYQIAYRHVDSCKTCQLIWFTHRMENA